MMTEATVANIATTGSVTMAMMKRAGYEARFAPTVRVTLLGTGTPLRILDPEANLVARSKLEAWFRTPPDAELNHV